MGMSVSTAICKKCGREIFKTYLYKREGTWIAVRGGEGSNDCKPHEPYGK